MSRPLSIPLNELAANGDFILVRGKGVAEKARKYADRHKFTVTRERQAEPKDVVAERGPLYRIERTS